MHKIEQSGGYLGRLLGPLLKTGLPLIKNLLKLLAKSFLIPLKITAAASPINAAIHKKMFGSGVTTLLTLNKEMNDIMKIVKSGLLIKDVRETIKNETIEQKGGFIEMLLRTLDVNLLANLLTGKRTI